MIAIFGLVHFTFLFGAIVLGICFLLILQRYLAERNFLTLIFSTFLLTYVVTGLIFFMRGLYIENAPEDIFLFRLTLIMPMILATLMTSFIVLPLIGQKEGTTLEKVYKGLLLVIGIELVLEMIIALSADVVFTFTADSLAHYTLTPFVPTYALLIFFILSTAAITFILLLQMVIKETESFYRMKALLLLIGWVFVVVGQVMFLSAATAFLNPPMGGFGMLLIAIAILRKPPS